MPEQPPIDDNTRDTPDPVPKRILHYTLIHRIGGGGMGEVYLARDERLDRLVALKTLSPKLSSSRQSMDRLMAEAKASARLNHKNICGIYAIEEVEDRLFISMEYVQGATLKDLLGDEQLDVKRIRDIAKQCCDGLAAAHSEGIIHRDIKSSNIMLDKYGTIKILDFGLAKVVTDESATETAGIAGTYQYMSPEQISGAPVDSRSDIFSLGTVLYELLTGHLPFQGENLAATAYAIVHADPAPISDYRRDVTPELETIVARALAKDVDRRYQTAAAMQQDIGSTDSVALAAEYIPSLARTTVAVFPFRNLSSGSETEYLSEGICDDVVTALAKIPQLSVASRAAVRRLLGKEMDALEVSEELNVSHFLEGSLRRQDKTTRLNAQLTRVSDGIVVWSENFVRKTDDLFCLQADVAAQVAAALNIALTDSDIGRTEALQVNPEAYELYLQGCFNVKRRDETSLIRAVELLSEATRIDDSFAPAFGELAVACSLCEVYGYQCDTDILSRAGDFANRAIGLDPGSSQAHMSMFFTLRRMDIRRAIAELRIATALDGSNSEAYHYLAHSLVFCGQYKSAEKAELAANRLDPFMEMSDALLSRIYYFTDQDAKLKRQEQVMARKYSQSHVVHSTRGWVDWCSQRWEAAAENYRKALGKEPSDNLIVDHLADCQIRLGNTDRAIELLEARLSEDEGANMIRARLGQAYAALGAKSISEENFVKADSGLRKWAIGHRAADSALHYFQMSWLHCLRRDRSAAMENMRAAIERGYGNYAELRVRPDWDILRGDREFENLLRNLADEKKSEDSG